MKILETAKSLMGTAEIKGNEHNPVILGWAEYLGKSHRYTEDEIPWCGLFAAYVLKTCGHDIPRQFLAARSFLEVGTAISEPEVGCLVIFQRGKGGHVGFVVGIGYNTLRVLGGNQSDRVKISTYATDNVLGYRRIGKTDDKSRLMGVKRKLEELLLEINQIIEG